jgi:pimeloyl-ACP methyl ester carboxylesterase
MSVAQIVGTEQPERLMALVLLDTVSYDSWPSETWREIIRKMTGETLEAYLAPHRGAIVRASFFEHQVRHYDSRYTERVVDRLGQLTMPVRILWGAEDRWQPTTYAERLATPTWDGSARGKGRR